MPFVDRTTFIELLDKLRSEDEAEVVAAARDINRRMDEAELSWRDVLAPEQSDQDDLEDDDEADDFEDNDDDDEDDFDEDDEVAFEGEDAKQAAAQIERILARYELSDTTEEDLRDYLTDIAEGEFTEADNRYVQALHKRLKAQQGD
ncbi:MAG: hypothetical protein QNJ84_07665 [Alphaproteobacteria bacterium]|nr:hypothetical protein [Alphaproteobacteria bacterium]